MEEIGEKVNKNEDKSDILFDYYTYQEEILK